MKKKLTKKNKNIAAAIIPFLFYCFTPQMILAQEFKAGILGGLTATQVSGDGLAGFDKAGITVGAFVEKNMLQKLSLHFEINFIQKGSRSRVNPDNNYFYRLRLSYIEVPVLAHYLFKSKFSLGAGASVATLIASSEGDVFGTYPETLPFKKIDISGLADGGYLLNEKFTIHVRYSQSIIPVRKLDDVIYTATLQAGQYNSVLSLFFKYHF